MKIEPTYTFTEDGENPLAPKATGKLSIRWSGLQRNDTIIRNLLFWTKINCERPEGVRHLYRWRGDCDFAACPHLRRTERGIEADEVQIGALLNIGAEEEDDLEEAARNVELVESEEECRCDGRKRLNADILDSPTRRHLEPRGARGSHDEKTATAQDTARAVSFTERLIEQAPPTFLSFFIDEPKLVFGDGELCADPKTGISAFGPIVSGLSKRVIRIGIIGTGKGIDAMRAYLNNPRARIEPGLNSKGKLFDTFCFPDFPGIDKSFRVSFDTDPRIQRSIPLDYFKNAVTSNNPATRRPQVVSLVTKELGARSQRWNGDPTLWLSLCRPKLKKRVK